MKKLVLILAVAGFAVACNSSSDKKTEVKDTAVVTAPDTAKPMMADTTKPMMADTTKH